MKKRLVLCLAVILMTSLSAYSDDNYAIEIETDKKILHVEQFKLPESATILEVLSIMPELLNRSEETILGNYDVKINGFSLGSTFEGTLSQIRLGQVEKIEISESPLDSYRNNGQGGSINIVLKPLNEGVSGEASLAAFSMFDIKPMAIFGFKKNGLTLHAIAEFDYYRPHNLTSATQGFNGVGSVPYEQRDSTSRRYLNETVRLLIEYKPSDDDVFKLRLSEFYTKDDLNQISDIKKGDVFTKTDKSSYAKKFGINMNTSFKHTFASKSTLMIEANYAHTPSEESFYVIDYRTVTSDNLVGMTSGKIEYEQPFKLANPDNFLKLFVGFNTNFTSNEKYDNLEFLSHPDESEIMNSVVHTWFLSPYLKFDAKLGDWRLKAEVEYQDFNYQVRGYGNIKFKQKRRDLTGKAMAGWQINDNNHLQLILDRKLDRPNGALLYPYLAYDADDDRLEIGNPDLTPMIINEVSLNYISNWAKGRHSFVFNGKLRYMNVSDLIVPVKTVTVAGLPCYTAINEGVNNILAGEAVLFYSFGNLGISLVGNIYNNHQSANGDFKDKYTYYNISLYPTLKLAKEWDIATKFTYHSAVKQQYAEIGPATTLMLTVGKNWNRFSLHLMGVAPLNGQSVDISQGADITLKKTYYYQYPYAGLTFNYKF